MDKSSKSVQKREIKTQKSQKMQKKLPHKNTRKKNLKKTYVTIW